MEDCVAILPAMLEIIPQIYEASLNSSLLDLVKQVSLLSLLGEEYSVRVICIMVLSSLCFA